MSSILTNVGAMTALQTLRSVSNSLMDTQDRISTGMRVAKASDNAAYWAIATTMRTDMSGFSAITDSLGLGLSTAGMATAANDAIVKKLQLMKDAVLNAQNPNVDRAKINDSIQQMKAEMETIITSASFNGANWLDGSINSTANAGTTFDILASLVRSGSTVTPEYIVFDPQFSDYGHATDGLFRSQLSTMSGTATAGLLGTGILGADFAVHDGTNPAAATDLEGALLEVEAAIAKATEVGSLLGSIETRIGNQNDFMTKMIDAMERGIGVLVDADMNEESARLKALQVQQQLAIEALNIANSEPQNILALFR